MKLADHVDHLRELIEAAFDKQFSRLGFGKTKQMDAAQVEKLPEEVKAKRERFVVMLDNHIGETGCYESAREKLLDELTFTLFNRLAAIKVMEAASLFPPILTKQSEHGDRSFGHKAWLEINPHMRNEELEGVRDYLKAAFDELGQTLPLYSKAYPYALLPDAVSLNDIIDAFNAVDTDAQANDSSEETIWQSDDVLGWMYESYNNKKKQAHKDSKDKTEYNKVSLQSQVYTPRWVVQFLVENSLGKMYLEIYPNSEIKQRYKIANAPTTQTRTPKPLHEVRTIDPACGSGNFLLYAFDFYYELYLDQIENYGADYDEKDIPKLIIENNLHGIDLDDRAVQLAQLGLFIKAKKKRRTVGELNFRVVSSDFYLPEYNEVRHIFEQPPEDGRGGIERNQKELIEKIWNDLQYAYKFGSLVHIDEQLNKQLHTIEERAEDDLFAKAELSEHQDFAANFFSNLTQAVEQYARTGSNTFLSSKTRDAIRFLELLTTEYDVATANPPYTDSADFGPDLKEFIDENYKKPHKFHSNLYATFIKRCYDLAGESGFIAMVHPLTFMYIKSFDGVRKFIIKNTSINILAELGLGGVFANSDVQVDPVMYVLERRKVQDQSVFMDFKKYKNNTMKPQIFKDSYDKHLNNNLDSHTYILSQDKFKQIDSWPFIYWISDDFRQIIKNLPLSKEAEVISGMKTGNNEATLRFWWELERKDIRTLERNNADWIPYAKGGVFKKWAGNIWLCLNWKNAGEAVLSQKNYNIVPKKYFTTKGVTYGARSAKGVSYRYLGQYELFDMVSGGVFLEEESLFGALGTLNSKLIYYITNCLNPTSTTQPNDIKRLPFVGFNNAAIANLSENNYDIVTKIDSYSLVDFNFTKSPLHQFSGTFWDAIKQHLNSELHLTSLVLVNESIIDDLVFSEFKIPLSDINIIKESEGKSVVELPISTEAKNSFIAEAELNKQYVKKQTLDYISRIETTEFSSAVSSRIEKELTSLWQGNSTLEEFCLQNSINPINVWYWFKHGNVLPKQRMQTLAMEFLTDMVRDVLMEDEDGIIPLVPNAGEKILIDQVESKIFKKGFSSAQYSSFDSVLGRPVREYINKYFFKELSDHIKLFKRLPPTPFIWHLTSGPEQGFDCYIIIYKWSRDNLLRLRSVYIENRERALQNRQSDIADNESAEAQNEKERIFKQLKEIDAFKKKIDELLADGYNPILDDGVGKNIAPLQKKKMLAYDVLNAGQLKKYLNADW